MLIWRFIKKLPTGSLKRERSQRSHWLTEKGWPWMWGVQVPWNWTDYWKIGKLGSMMFSHPADCIWTDKRREERYNTQRKWEKSRGHFHGLENGKQDLTPLNPLLLKTVVTKEAHTVETWRQPKEANKSGTAKAQRLDRLTDKHRQVDRTWNRQAEMAKTQRQSGISAVLCKLLL